jgi:polyhydroxyalkanoate synthesis regulator phasin
MARDDRFKKYQEAGAEFLEAARIRAEEFLQELARMGDSTQKQAQGAMDDFVGGGRKGTEQILTTIRREITAQLSQLGLATKQDLTDLERRLRGAAGAGGAGPAPVPATPPKKAAPAKAAPKKATAAKGAADKAPAKKKAAGKKAAPAKKAAGEV